MITGTKLSDGPRFDYPMDMLRDMVSAFDRCDESFLDDKTIPQLINIYNCWMRCGWDIFPDNWEPKQVREAMRGICPNWIETRTELKAVYATNREDVRKIAAVSLAEKAP